MGINLLGFYRTLRARYGLRKGFREDSTGRLRWEVGL